MERSVLVKGNLYSYKVAKPRSVAGFLIILSLASCQSTPISNNEPAVQSAEQPSVPSEVSVENHNDSVSQPRPIEPVRQSDLWQRISDGFQLQEHYDHPSVLQYRESYQDNQRLFDLIALRAAPFLYRIVEESESRKLPLELALLPIVESTFDPNAYSSEHAVGLWQFLAATARSFGVQIDWWYDGRRDPIVSTIAALDYLSALHEQFNQNWLVAIGAYNTGDGNIRRAMRRGGQDFNNLDFWTLPLAPETRAHVPKLLALASIILDIDTYAVNLPPLLNEEVYSLVDLPAQIDLNQAAALSEQSLLEIKSANPGYLQWATHPSGPYSLWIPQSKVETFKHNFSELDPAKRVTWDRYAIKDGDSLSSIAKKLGTRVDILIHANQLENSRIIAGESLLIPRNFGAFTDTGTFPIANQKSNRVVAAVPAAYTVRRGDNLWRIARRFDLRSKDIASWNNITLSTLLFPGDELDLSYANSRDNLSQTTDRATGRLEAGHYRIIQGDTIEKIARKTGLTTDELLLWNNLTASQMIFPDQVILLTPPQQGIN